MAVGGAAYLVSRAIKGAKVVGFEDLGMEAIYEFTSKDMPVTVAVDARATMSIISRRLCGGTRSPRKGCWRAPEFR
jgi:fumarate hydratase class I